MESDFEPRSLLTTADDREFEGIGSRREELVVLAEPEILYGRSFRERHLLQLDHAAHAGAVGEVTGVDAKAVGDVEHRVRIARERRAAR